MPHRLRSTYREIAAPPALARYVDRLWVQVIGDIDRGGDGGHYPQPVLPDGCLDVVALDGGVHLAGPATGPTTVDLRPGAVTVGARFRPGAAPPLIGASAAEARDLLVPAGELWGRAGDDLVERSAAAPGVPERLQVLVDGLTGRLPGAGRPDPVAALAVAALVHGSRPVGELAREAALSERQLRRRVEDAVGYPPRTFARIQRFQRFLRAARASRGAARSGTGRRGPFDLARLAALTGYSDQAHLTRESRRLAGLPPAALLRWEERRLEPGRAGSGHDRAGQDDLAR